MPSAEPTPIATASRWRALTDPLNKSISALGLTQIVGWGTTVYVLAVLGKPISIDTGWSATVVYGGLTVGMLVSAAMAIPAGRWLDARGGRHIMTLGSVVAGVSLALLSQANSIPFYLAAWALVGVAMRLALYDAAFVSLVQMSPARGKRAISFLTLPGGLASTIMWPAAAYLDFEYGWRTTLLLFAALNLFICAPLHWFWIGRQETPTKASASERTAHLATPSLTGPRRTTALLLLSLVMSSTALVIGTMAAHLVQVLASTGLDARVVLILAAAKGVAQTAARALDIMFGKRLPAMSLARITCALLPISFAALLAAGTGGKTAAVFVALFGAANGLMTIVRGTVPLALFGPTGYGAVMGQLATPIAIMNALAPMAFAFLIDATSMKTGIYVILAVSIVAVAAMEFTAHWASRAPRASA